MSAKYTKKELAKELKGAFSLTKDYSESIMDFVVETIVDKIKENKTVYMKGLGTFTVIEKKERNGINPHNGKPIVISKRKKIKFRVSNSLKDVLLK